LPLLHIHFKYGDNEKAMKKDIRQTAVDMLEKTGFSNIEGFQYDPPAGSAVHEMGTLRMGRDPKTSVLNGNNQVHSVKNLFITDGSCMTSSAWQNPSLTYMALTARACDFAVNELKKGNL
jgi:choline dehydrogenase-like flavoprotein